jgi:aspartate/methionine/tyrosine aminotransferase
MFSKRLAWDQSRNRISERLETRKSAVLDLTESNPTRAGFRWPSDLLSVLADPRGMRYDPDPRGLQSAREAVAEYQGVNADRVLLTASTSEAYGYLFKLLCDPGDEILAPRPSYPLFEFLARLESVRVVQYPLFYDHGWSIDLAALETLITPRTRAIVLVNPNNPTGSFLKHGELTVLERLCARHDLALISDEVFADFAFAEPEVRNVARSVKDVVAFSLGGLSKACGLPQLKLGWIVSNSTAALERLELVADTYLSVSTPVQVALPRLLEARHEIQRQMLARLRTNLATVSGALVTEGGWTAVLRVPEVKSDEQWVLDLLDEHDVLVQPGFFYDFPSGAHIVVSLLTPEAIFAEGMKRVEHAINFLLQG